MSFGSVRLAEVNLTFSHTVASDSYNDDVMSQRVCHPQARPLLGPERIDKIYTSILNELSSHTVRSEDAEIACVTESTAVSRGPATAECRDLTEISMQQLWCRIYIFNIIQSHTNCEASEDNLLTGGIIDSLTAARWRRRYALRAGPPQPLPRGFTSADAPKLSRVAPSTYGVINGWNRR